ncbi:MAG: hypothetical protein MUC39_02860 [Candidatus Omnitrophica bacterium]|jgi:tRNA nucleotidyltransferase (CCA-adding enzyme)|nr:hypothetical protein [Candidatus Omnitrophota bacterium]
MKKYLQELPEELKKIIELCASTAETQGFKPYLVGGFVRDLLLGLKNLDLDIVIEGDGIKVAEELSKMLTAKLIRHRRFGTATLVLSHNLKIDIAGAREECYPEPACLPSVKSGSVKDDLKRRDFSINAMAVSLNKKDYGRLVDFFHGLDDLSKGKVRVLHSLSFIDDPTRILRAIRFSVRYGFSLEVETSKYLKEAVRLNMLQRVEPQRLRDELILILKEDNPEKQIRQVQQLAGLSFIHSGLKLAKNNFQLLKDTRQQVVWFEKNFSQRRHLDIWLMYLSALLNALSLRDTEQVLKAFVFRKGEEKRVISCKKISKDFIRKLSRKYVLPSLIFHLLNPLSYEAILLIRAKHKNKYLKKHIADFFKVYNSVRLLVTGHDLAAMGLKPGPHYQKIFLKLFNAKLDGKVRTEEEELEFIRKIAKF